MSSGVDSTKHQLKRVKYGLIWPSAAIEMAGKPLWIWDMWDPPKLLHIQGHKKTPNIIDISYGLGTQPLQSKVLLLFQTRGSIYDFPDMSTCRRLSPTSPTWRQLALARVIQLLPLGSTTSLPSDWLTSTNWLKTTMRLVTIHLRRCKRLCQTLRPSLWGRDTPSKGRICQNDTRTSKRLIDWSFSQKLHKACKSKFAIFDLI